MLFLIEYARSEGKVVKLTTFTDSELAEAQKQKLELELALNRSGIEHEVVILDALDENAVRRTHRRYFEDLSQIAESINGSK